MQRKQLIALRDDIRAGRIARLWVWRLDRITRSGIVDMLQAVQEIRKHGCELVSVADTFPLEGTSGELVLAVLAWGAQIEREKIRENQTAARARMTLEGRNWGRPRVVSGALREQALALKDQKLSLKQIARRLNISKTTAWTVLNTFDPQAAA
jgi:DNA invertase Pin-like site-specific DNA recombinase